MSDALLDRLCADLRPVPRLAVVRRLLLGALLGAAASAALVAATVGFRPDMAAAARTAMFWVKLAYALGLGGVGLWACERLSRPLGPATGRWRWLFAPVAVMVALAAWQLGHAAAGERTPMVMGHTARLCSLFILLFSVPPLTGVVWATRGLAPSRLKMTGAMVGLAAGGAGAAAYALHCDENAAPFLAVWYTLGVLLAGGLGWLLGPRALKW